jgi:glyoxylase-like metal-dependent hydrolase (beta-lactamase superfamily II)
MHRRHFLHQTTLLASASLLFQQKAMASILQTGDFQVKMLRNNVGIFTERGGTIGFLLSKNGTIVIDAQFPDTSRHLIDELKKQQHANFLYLLNTHHHGDHTAGNIAYKGLVEHVVAQENSQANQKRVAESNNTMDKQLLPDMTFKEDWKLKLDDEKIKAEYFGPGHTKGDAVYHIENANIIHAGDLMLNKRHPFVDRSAGANIANWIKYLDGILKMAGKDTIIIFGHSLNPGEETGTIEDVKKFQDYLGKVLSFAEAEIKKGVSKEEFIKNTSIPGVTEWTGQGIDRPLTAAYEELTEKK